MESSKPGYFHQDKVLTVYQTFLSSHIIHSERLNCAVLVLCCVVLCMHVKQATFLHHDMGSLIG